MLHAWRSAVLALMVALVLGCGGSDGRAVIKGKLMDKDKPFTVDSVSPKQQTGGKGIPPGTRPYVMALYPAEGGDMIGAEVDASTGTFTVSGPDGKGIKPGKYKIALSAPPGGMDPFNGKFTVDKTQIVRDLKPGEEVVIDVSKPTG